MAEAAAFTGKQSETGHAAEYLGVKVPASVYVTEARAERINAGRYEGQEIAGALHVVREGDVVLEIGAGLGVVGGVVTHNRKPKQVRAYEANPNMIPLVNALYELNGLTDRISVRNQVLISSEDRPDSLPFYIPSSYLGASLSTGGRPARETHHVPTVSFNDTCAELSPDVLIMDIEGGELELLRDADLSGFRAIVVEFHPKVYGREGMRECKSILTQAGFEKVEDVSTRLVWTCTRNV